jgi:hypothetical protein
MLLEFWFWGGAVHGWSYGMLLVFRAVGIQSVQVDPWQVLGIQSAQVDPLHVTCVLELGWSSAQVDLLHVTCVPCCWDSKCAGGPMACYLCSGVGVEHVAGTAHLLFSASGCQPSVLTSMEF